MKKIGLIALTLVLSLGLMGAGFAYWTETLTINSSVATGTFDPYFENAVGSDNESPPPDVGDCTADIDDDDPLSMTVTITTGYPCYTGYVDFDIVNGGTVPAKIKSMTIGITGNAVFDTSQGGTSGVITAAGQYVDINLDSTQDALADIRVTVIGMNVGDAIPLTIGGLEIHVWELSDEGTDATMNASGNFTMDIEATQFNS